MDITSVSPAIATPATENVSKSKATQSTASVTAADVYTSKIAAIAAKYDPKHMTLEQIPELGNELLKNGLISSSEAVNMVALPNIMRSLKGGESIGLNMNTDGTFDLLRYEKNQLKTAKSFGKMEQLDVQQKTVDTLEALSSNHKNTSGASTTPQGVTDVHGAISAYRKGVSDSTLDTQRVVDVLEALISYRKDK